jgi:3'(2'), 5'-bisphosphate nucleotidase
VASDPSTLLKGVLDAVAAASTAILEVYATAHGVEYKADESPITRADRAAHDILAARLSLLTPSIPVLSEEAEAAHDFAVRRAWPELWLVDPLDGTREFVNRNGEFTVNVALVHRGRPVLGVVLAPALGRLFAGALGQGAYVEEGGTRRAIRCRPVPDAGLTVVASRSHGDAAALDAFLAGRKVAARANSGSSLKLCLLAAGEADLYPRLGRTMEWDIAAGHAVLAAAGGRVTALDGTPLRYGKPGFENPHFVASGGA